MKNISNKNSYRYEDKFYVNKSDIDYIRSVFQSFSSLDQNTPNGKKDYCVTSLYFDTPLQDCFYEKIDGLLSRRKLRIRKYSNNTYKLEFKNRFDRFINKDSYVINKNDVKSILSGNYNHISSFNKQPFYYDFISNQYCPKVIVEYDREAYTMPYNNIRLTIDKNLRSYNAFTDLTKVDNQFAIPIFEDNLSIIEIKYNNFFPSSIARILDEIPSNRNSISKFIYCHKFIESSLFCDNILEPFWKWEQ